MKSNKEIIATMELNIQNLWERHYRNSLKMKLADSEETRLRYEKRSIRASVEAENAGYAYGDLLRDLGIKQKLNVYGMMVEALNCVNEMYKEELEELANKEKRVG